MVAQRNIVALDAKELKALATGHAVRHLTKICPENGDYHLRHLL